MQSLDSIQKVLQHLIDTHPLIKGNHNELARQTKTHQPNITRILTGETKNPSDRTIKPWADFFNVSLSQLRGYEPLPDSLIFTWKNAGHRISEDKPVYAGAKQYVASIPLKSWKNIASGKANGTISASLDFELSKEAFALFYDKETDDWKDAYYLIFDPLTTEEHAGKYYCCQLKDESAASLYKLSHEGDQVYFENANVKLNSGLLHAREFQLKVPMVGRVVPQE